MELPKHVESSKLYLRLQEDPTLLHTIKSLREISKQLAESISRQLPSFTDHSIRHMDALWNISERVLLPIEIESLTLGEAFLLASSFYLHDIGMAYAATEEGISKIKASKQYRKFKESTSIQVHNGDLNEINAISHAVRCIHATAALEFATHPIPGTSIFLIENTAIREAWAETCGTIASSHHWSLERIEDELGSKGTVPLPSGHKGDLGYVASILRLIDYAHINRDRASTVDRAFRQTISPDSLTHWIAQENIDGPERDGNELVYRSSRPISSVDAWWLYYSMLSGLDAEIQAVRRYLGRRPTSQGRFSLQSVRGASSPQEAATNIPTSGFLPIEVNLRTGSIDRLVQLLAGESLYGPDPMAAVRELIQNARDAVMLQATTATTELEKITQALPIKVSLRKDGELHFLEVTDWGIGMTPQIVTDFLLSIASDYWNTQFHTDYPNAVAQGFHQAGKFGIGFLSVFMLGDNVSVETNRIGGERIKLSLHGISRRGEIRTLKPQAGSGTSVCVQLKESVVDSLTPINKLVRTYAPLLQHSVRVESFGIIDEIESGWIFKMTPEEFIKWTIDALETLPSIRNINNDIDLQHMYFRRGYRYNQTNDAWPVNYPEYIDPNSRLVASTSGISLLCLKGIALQAIRTPGYVGVLNIDSVTPDVSRKQAINADLTEVLSRVRASTSQAIITNINALSESGFIGDNLGFISFCARHYNHSVITNSHLPWISCIKLPGEVELLSCSTFVEKANSSDSLFLAFGTGPWTAMKKMNELNQASSLSKFGIVIDDVDYIKPAYQDKIETGTLSELWPNHQDATLLTIILELLAQSWQTNIESISCQSTWFHKGSTIWGRVSKHE